MIKHLLFTTIRNLFKKKNLSFLIIISLTVSMITGIFVFKNVIFEYSFDRFHKNYNQIFRIKGTRSLMCGPTLTDNSPNIENYVRLHPIYGNATVQIDDKIYNETNVFYSDNSIFEIFNFPFKFGNPSQALIEKNSVVISESTAMRYFGYTEVFDKSLLLYDRYGGKCYYTITGVFKDIPDNSHLKFDLLFSINNVLENSMYSQENPWKVTNFITYLKSSPQVSKEKLSEECLSIFLQYQVPETNSLSDKPTIEITKLSDIHFNGKRSRNENNSTRTNLYFLTLLGIIIVGVSWINYANLLLVKNIDLIPKYGIQKAFGAGNKHIIQQVLSEVIITFIIVVVLSVGFQELLNPYINKFIGVNIKLPFYLIAWFWITVIISFFIGFVLTAYFPARFLNKYNVLNLLKSKGVSDSRFTRYMKPLLVFQFSSASILIIITMVISLQMNKLQTKEKGINLENVIAVKSPRISSEDINIYETRDIFTQEMQQLYGIEAITSSVYIPGMYIASNQTASIQNNNMEIEVVTRMNFVGYNYFDVYKNKIISGRKFSKEFRTDNDGVIINKKLLEQLGFDNPDEVIGKEVMWKFRSDRKRMILGVVENFNHQSAKQEVEPMMFHLRENTTGYYSIRFNPNLINTERIEIKWKEYFDNNPFDYFYMKDYYSNQLISDFQLKRIFTLLTFLAIMLTCVGLYSFIKQILNNRTKEIAIRKVNGATVMSIVKLINVDVLKWYLISFIISLPIAWFAMNSWLSDFAFRIVLSWWIFLSGGIIISGLLIITVSWQCWKVAIKNPSETLRHL